MGLGISVFCLPQADFVISNMQGKKVGSNGKTTFNVANVARGDRFIINFPPSCLPEMKATLLAAAFLLDFLFYKDQVQDQDPRMLEGFLF